MMQPADYKAPPLGQTVYRPGQPATTAKTPDQTANPADAPRTGKQI